MTDSLSGPPRAARPAPHSPPRSLYLEVLALAFALFNSARLVSYLPTLWALQASGDSSQHSLWTWCCWFGANLTMAAWVREHNGHRIDRVVVLNAGNALMCGATIGVIVFYRLGGAP
jgi:hypothetical protein